MEKDFRHHAGYYGDARLGMSIVMLPAAQGGVG